MAARLAKGGAELNSRVLGSALYLAGPHGVERLHAGPAVPHQIGLNRKATTETKSLGWEDQQQAGLGAGPVSEHAHRAYR